MVSALSQAIYAENWSEAINLLKSKKDLGKQFSNRPGFFEGLKASTVLPIHEVCANPNAPFELVQTLVGVYPESLKVTESAYQRLPLHICCRKHANYQVVNFFLDEFVGASLIPDTLGRLPLHYSLSNGAEDDIVGLILTKSANAARGTDRRGWLPLHVACSVGASTNVISRLLDAYPEGSITLTDKGTSLEKCMDAHQAANKYEVYQLLAKHREAVNKKLGRPARRPSLGRPVV